MTEETPENIEKQKDDIANLVVKKLIERTERKEKEEKQKLAQKEETERAYAVCNGCRRLLNRVQYDAPSCICGSDSATIIQY